MKTWFLQRSPRERLLLLVFLLAIALGWLVSALGRWRMQRAAAHTVTTQLETQQLWLDRRTEIEARATRAAAALDPAHTLDATRLVGEVSALAASAGLSAGVEPPRTQRTGQFAYHTVQVSFRRADLAAVVKFYRALAKRAPYLALEECALTANRNNPAEIDARFAVFAVEVSP